MSLNFTGTFSWSHLTKERGIERLLTGTVGTALQLNHTTSPAITLEYFINGTAIQSLGSSSPLGQPISLTKFDLPLGHHEFRLESTRPEDGGPSDTSLFHGVTVTSGLTPGGEAREMGIDDSAWRTGAITLTEGWNMLETPFEGSNFIDTVCPGPIEVASGMWAMGAKLRGCRISFKLNSKVWRMTLGTVYHSHREQDQPCPSLSKVRWSGHMR